MSASMVTAVSMDILLPLRGTAVRLRTGGSGGEDAHHVSDSTYPKRFRQGGTRKALGDAAPAAGRPTRRRGPRASPRGGTAMATEPPGRSERSATSPILPDLTGGAQLLTVGECRDAMPHLPDYERDALASVLRQLRSREGRTQEGDRGRDRT